jgi:hypothetical protein
MTHVSPCSYLIWAVITFLVRAIGLCGIALSNLGLGGRLPGVPPVVLRQVQVSEVR